jgi:hypothetical protein
VFIRKLLDWKTLFIYVHRWTGIVLGLVFVVWFVSGIAMMYVRMPVLSDAERLGHVPPLDLSAARVSPDAAMRANDVKGGPVQLEMFYDGRPIYRFGGDVKVYADTGERVPGVGEAAALEMVRRWVPPQFAGTVLYDGYLLDSDVWTLYGAQRSAMPLHRISVGDPAGTVYYVSETTGEMNHKTDRRGRFWGFLSGVLHYIYIPAFRRNAELWREVVGWGAVVGSVMALLGLVVGVVRLRVRKYRLRSGPSHSPYVGWMKWHHYSGLIFGVLSITWAFSGAMSLSRPFPSLRNNPPTPAQRTAVAGRPLDANAVTLDRLRASLDVVRQSFTPKVAQVRQFRGEPYLVAYEPPEPWSYAREIGSQEERIDPPRAHLIVPLSSPERGAFARFEDARMWEVAKAAMPGVPVQDAVWLQDYDSYYYDKNRQRPLPVLRVRYADEAGTWLYLDPSLGTMTKQERGARWNRWLYHGLHSLDFPFLRYKRPLWDIVMIVLSIGGLVLSMTTLVPSWRRLVRHARHIRATVAARVARRRRSASGARRPAPQLPQLE